MQKSQQFLIGGLLLGALSAIILSFWTDWPWYVYLLVGLGVAGLIYEETLKTAARETIVNRDAHPAPKVERAAQSPRQYPGLGH